MKIEFEIKDIERDEIVDAMARQMLTEMVSEEMDPEEGGGVHTYVRRSQLADDLRKSINAKISDLAENAVRECFDSAIKERIAATVDEVLEAGWVKTDGYGNPKGERTDLKGRINEVITEKKSHRYGQPEHTLADRLVVAKVEELFHGELGKEVEAARLKLRQQLDTVIAGKFAETLKSAMGIR